ncbi:MAG: hypothetical protein IMZ47_01610, partial [Firmicutes bacterium]|nr:hypothetical protein [Bacillota bacterium]
VAVAGKDKITSERYELIKIAFENATKDRDSMLEKAALHDFYVSLVILCSFDFAIGDIINGGIGQCNFLQSNYYATNVEIPTDDRIRDWLDGKLDEDEFISKHNTTHPNQ